MRVWAAGLVALVWGTGGAAQEASPCHAFTADADYVEQTIVMPLERVRVPLQVPVQYFEDGWDRLDGFEDTAQLFSVDMDDWTPVSRPETAVRKRTNRPDYMWFTVGDSNGLDPLSLFFARGHGMDTPTALPHGQDGPAGLTWLDTERSSASNRPEKDLFVVRSSDGMLETLLHCTSPLDPMSAVPGCNHYFRAAGLDVELSYRRVSIDRWRKLQSDVTAFLNCATRPAP